MLCCFGLYESMDGTLVPSYVTFHSADRLRGNLPIIHRTASLGKS